MQVGDLVEFTMPDNSKVNGFISFIRKDREELSITLLNKDGSESESVISCAPTVLPFAPFTYKKQVEQILEREMAF